MNRNQMRLLFSILLVSSCSVDAIEHTDVFTSGAGGYHTYRIPAAIVSAKGTVLAFCEGRKKSRSDTGDIDLVLRRSTDQGKTWGEPRVVWDDGGNTCGNPCPVLDRDTGTLWLLLTWNAGEIHESKVKPGFGLDSRRVFVTHSTDDGLTWAEPSDITTVAKNKAWSWYATGPGAGIQLQHGAHKGRLVIP
jgi:sialidase-1